MVLLIIVAWLVELTVSGVETRDKLQNSTSSTARVPYWLDDQILYVFWFLRVQVSNLEQITDLFIYDGQETVRAFHFTRLFQLFMADVR